MYFVVPTLQFILKRKRTLCSNCAKLHLLKLSLESRFIADCFHGSYVRVLSHRKMETLVQLSSIVICLYVY